MQSIPRIDQFIPIYIIRLSRLSQSTPVLRQLQSLIPTAFILQIILHHPYGFRHIPIKIAKMMVGTHTASISISLIQGVIINQHKIFSGREILIEIIIHGKTEHHIIHILTADISRFFFLIGI